MLWSNDLPGGSEFTQASEGPQNGGKMTGMDLLEFRDINGPKNGAIWSIGCQGWIAPAGLFRVNYSYIITEFIKKNFKE